MLNLDERDASELVLAIGGYYLLATGRTLTVRQDASAQQDDAGGSAGGCGVNWKLPGDMVLICWNFCDVLFRLCVSFPWCRVILYTY